MAACNNKKEDKIGYSGRDLSGKVFLERDTTSNVLYLITEIENKFDLYAGRSVESIDLSSTLLRGDKSGRYSLDEDSRERNYYQFVSSEGNALLAETHLPLTGSYNFRDLGGIRTKDGYYVKWGRLFRSDDLQHLTDSDLAYLNSIPLVSIVDFRSVTEIKDAPDRVAASVKNEYKLSISPGNLTDISPDMLADLTVEQGEKFMHEINHELVSSPIAIEQYRKFFEILQNESNLPLVFHCTAGKDRTGMGAYLFLTALNVDEEIIMENYLASNQYLKKKYAPYVQQYPSLKPFMEVDRSYIQTGIEEIKKEYGTVKDYLINVLNVDLDRMKDIYLY